MNKKEKTQREVQKEEKKQTLEEEESGYKKRKGNGQAERKE